MVLSPQSILNQFNNILGPTQTGISINEILGYYNWNQPTWIKIHGILRKIEAKIKNLNETKGANINPLGFTYQIREKYLDRESFLVLFCFVALKKAFSKKKAIQKIVTFMEEIRQCENKEQTTKKP